MLLLSSGALDLVKPVAPHGNNGIRNKVGQASAFLTCQNVEARYVIAITANRHCCGGSRHWFISGALVYL
jgi:hypothetical protein